MKPPSSKTTGATSDALLIENRVPGMDHLGDLAQVIGQRFLSQLIIVRSRAYASRRIFDERADVLLRCVKLHETCFETSG